MGKRFPKAYLALIGVLTASLAFVACIPTSGDGKKPSSPTLRPSPAPNQGGVVSAGLTAPEAFKTTLHLQIQSRTCVGCHRTTGTVSVTSPFFAEAEYNTAYAALNSAGKINLSSPAGSQIVLKVLSIHNCGSEICANIANAFTTAITNMAILMQPPTPKGGGGGAGGGGGSTTIPGLSSMEAFERSLYPTLINTTGVTCKACHGDAGPQASFAGSNLKNAHDALVGSGIVDLSDSAKAATSLIVMKIRAGHNANPTSFADLIASKIVVWRALMQPVAGSTAPPPNGRLYSSQVPSPQDLGVTPVDLTWDVSAQAVAPAGTTVRFQVTVVKLDDASYLFTRPRIQINNGSVIVKNVMIHINNLFNANDASFTVLDEEIVAPGKNLDNAGRLPNIYMVMLKSSNPATEKLGVSFQMIKVR